METIRPIIGCNSIIEPTKPFIGIFSTHSDAPDTYLSGRRTAEKDSGGSEGETDE